MTASCWRRNGLLERTNERYLLSACELLYADNCTMKDLLSHSPILHLITDIGDVVPLSPLIKTTRLGIRWYQNAKDFETVFEARMSKRGKTMVLGAWSHRLLRGAGLSGLASASAPCLY